MVYFEYEKKIMHDMVVSLWAMAVFFLILELAIAVLLKVDFFDIVNLGNYVLIALAIVSTVIYRAYYRAN